MVPAYTQPAAVTGTTAVMEAALSDGRTRQCIALSRYLDLLSEGEKRII